MKINPNIINLALVNSFVRNAFRPFAAARLRLVLAFGLAIVLGLALAKVVEGTPLQRGLPAIWLLTGLFYFVVSVASFFLLILFSSFYRTSRLNVLVEMAGLWPVNRTEAWL